jgi:hypothetical protein
MDEAPKNPDEWYLNTHSNRYCRVGGKLHTRLLKESHTAPKVEPAPEDLSKGNIKVQEVNPNAVLRHRLMEESTDMIKENMESFGNVENMSQKELDKMLKKLLMEKLGLGERKKSKRKTKKKKSKARFKVVAPPPSSSESDTESDSN